MALIREMVVDGATVRVYDDYAVKTEEEKRKIIREVSRITNDIRWEHFLEDIKNGTAVRRSTATV